MTKGNLTIYVSCSVEAGFDELKGIAEDIGELVDMIPDYQQCQAKEITDRIQGRFKKLIKLKNRAN